jgi:SAM-dependent methyltransferase
MILSPVTHSENVQLKDSISSPLIINLYKKDFGIDVSRFFKHCDVVSIFRCNDTGLYFYYPRDLDGDEMFYDDIKREISKHHQAPYYSETKWEYERCVDMINIGNKVYEVGAGNGAFLKKLRNRGVVEIDGSELNLDAIRDAASQRIIIKQETIQEKAQQGKNLYDIVCTFQVLEHVSEIHSFINACLDILKPGGKFIVAVPYNSPYLFNHDRLNTLNMPPHHMNLWNRESFEKLPGYFPVKLLNIIVEKLARGGYDMERFYEMNKDNIYPLSSPFKKIFDKIYYWWLKYSPIKKNGKNIIAVFEKT